MLWHQRMGHISSQNLLKLRSVATGVKDLIFNSNLQNCMICSQAKLTRKAFNKDRDRASRFCEIVHADLIGRYIPSEEFIYFMRD